MSTVVPIRPGKTPPPQQVCIMVGSSSGGASSTTTALGLATAITTPKFPVVVADGTTDGGNLFERAAAHTLDNPVTAGLPVSSAATTSNATVCGPTSDRSDLTLIDSIFASRGAARIYDVGTALDAPRVASLRGQAVLVLTAIARAEPLTRLRGRLEHIRAAHGATVLARTVVVISHTIPAGTVDLSAVRSGLTPVLAALVEVPFDNALAAPGMFDHRRVAPATTAAWSTAASAALALSLAAVDPETDQQRKREQA